MKYIKTFEELNPSTYASASKELRELGFEDRANNLKEVAIDNFFKELFDGMYTMEHEDYPKSILFVKKINDKVIVYMEQDPKNGWLWCSYGLIWLFFKDEIGLEYKDIQVLINERVEKAFNLKVGTPNRVFISNDETWWKRLLI